MTRVLELLTDWLSLASVGADAVTYAAMALLGTTLFILRLVVAMFGDILGEFGLEIEADTDNSFTLFSLLSVMAGLSLSLLNLRVADSLFSRQGRLFYATSATAPSGGASASRAATR